MINMEVAMTILGMDREDMGSKDMDKVVKMDMGHKEDTEDRVMGPKILVVEKLQELVDEVETVDSPIKNSMIKMHFQRMMMNINHVYLYTRPSAMCNNVQKIQTSIFIKK